MSKIDDVARLAGVSKGTVSNVYSGIRPTSEQTRTRVLEAAKTLKYIPNHIARCLVTKKTMVIGLKMPYGRNLNLSSLHTSIIGGMVKEAALKNYKVLIDIMPESEQNIDSITTEFVDGVVVLGPEKKDKRIRSLMDANIPLVTIGSYPKEEVMSVDTENEKMAYEVTTYLIGLNHKKILFLNAPEGKTVSEQRGKGFNKAISEFKLDKSMCLEVYNEYEFQDPSKYGYKKALEYLKEKNNFKFTAVIADTDLVAIGVLKAFNENEINVPEKVSIIALSDDSSLAYGITPSLTSVDLYPEFLGSEAVRLLINKIESQENIMSLNVIAPYKIKERKSCKKICGDE